MVIFFIFFNEKVIKVRQIYHTLNKNQNPLEKFDCGTGIETR